MELKEVGEVCVDEANKLVTTPAYMNGTAKFHEVQDGVGNMVEQLLKMA
jgi:enhancing lycopene biosynthesis protein 2